MIFNEKGTKSDLGAGATGVRVRVSPSAPPKNPLTIVSNKDFQKLLLQL